MRLDDRFDELVVSLGGFYRTWYVFAGLELGLLAAAARGRRRRPHGGRAGRAHRHGRRRWSGSWSWGADVHDLVELDGDRIVLFDDVAGILLDADRPEYLGGQFLHAAIGSLDFAGLPGHLPQRQPAGRRARTATGWRSSA